MYMRKYVGILWMPKEDVKSPEVEVVGGYGPHKRYGFWKVNLGPVQEQ